MNLPPLVITSGEPAGIGIDICLDLNPDELSHPVVIVGDYDVFTARAKLLNRTFRLPEYCESNTEKISFLHRPVCADVEAGELNPQNAAYVIDLLDTAYDGIVQGRFSGMVTAPLHKGVINDACLPNLPVFTGHTEYLADISQTQKVVMMLSGGGLRVALATTHLPLCEVSQNLTAESLSQTIAITLQDLKNKWGIKQPHLAVCGLNPHAGENGYLGREEIEIIQPVIDQFQAAGERVFGAFPADTIFQPFMLQDVDAVLAMYHDQGLPVLKYASFGSGVNITLGLPFIRTSVDHGTALNLAGTGKAHSGSLKTAIQTAFEMVQASQTASPFGA
ncbi:MAG: 4-hydroxythreonine-4-phosphate dehydrogenase PdxA [Neisseriaceae bacterium]|nr:4-hydroxythreonine-4-phosphate dehydrogenase PdxA [Neisseriaceae bacterium]